MRFMSPAQALAALRFAQEFHEGKHSLPPEVVAVKVEIERATRTAELFIITFRVVDEGMVRKVVELMRQRDALYAQWMERETSGIVH